MYYQEKKNNRRHCTGDCAADGLLYLRFLGKWQQGVAVLEDTKYFAVTMLVFIGVGIAVTIAVQVIFHVLMSVSIAVHERKKDSKEIESAINAAMVEDERDKIIELKSMRITMIVTMVGFVAGLILLAFEYPAAIMLNLLFIAASLGCDRRGYRKADLLQSGRTAWLRS